MCFSATASFIASSVLIPTGAYAYRRSNDTTRWIAVIPFLFGVQQAIEGVQWLVLQKSGPDTQLMYAYLFFAFGLWSWYLPLAVYKNTQSIVRKRILSSLIGLGIVSVLLITYLAITRGISINVHDYCINYNMYLDGLTTILVGGLYIFSAVMGFLFAEQHNLRIIGYLSLPLLAVALYFYFIPFVSVWCFFAACTSFLCVRFVLHQKRSRKPTGQ